MYVSLPRCLPCHASLQIADGRDGWKNLVPSQWLRAAGAGPFHGGASGHGVEAERLAFQADLVYPSLMAQVPLPLVQAGEGHWPEDADVPQLEMVTVVLQHHAIQYIVLSVTNVPLQCKMAFFVALRWPCDQSTYRKAHC